MILEKETILEKIHKLKAMQDSASELGNDHEASAFAAKVQSLLFRYKIEMSEVEGFDLSDDISIEKEDFSWEGAGIAHSGKSSHWLSLLAHVVAEANGCKSFCMRRTNKVRLVGTKESKMITEYMLEVLARYGNNSSEKSYKAEYAKAKKQGSTCLMKGYKRAFLSAFVAMIGKRLKEETKKSMDAVSEKGLMVINAEEHALKVFLAPMATKSKSFTGTRNRAGHDAGTQAGQNANIGYNAVGTDGKRVKNLS
jgi:hypothetical protein